MVEAVESLTRSQLVACCGVLGLYKVRPQDRGAIDKAREAQRAPVAVASAAGANALSTTHTRIGSCLSLLVS